MTAFPHSLKFLWLLALGAILSFVAPTAKGQLTSAIQTANGTSYTITQFLSAGQGCNVGWTFSVTSIETLMSLGIYDAGADGLATSHQVGIWNASGTLLASTTVPAGASATLSGSYRYVAVTPLILTPGQTYTVGALYLPNTADTFIALSSQTYATGIAYGNSEQTFGSANPTFAEPTTGASVNQGVFGPTFQFTPVPEPSTWVLLGVGAAGLGLTLRRRA